MGYVQKEYAIGRIKWKLYHNAPYPESLPEGQWGINSQGDYYLCEFDDYGSYYYFNANYSWYFSDGKPGNLDAEGAALFTTPQGDTIYRPSTISQSQANSTYFISIDWRTNLEKIYWNNGNGKIVRTFRKDVEARELDKYNIRTLKIDNKAVIIDVDEEGSYIGDDLRIIGALKLEKMGEARQPRVEMLRSPRKEARREETSFVQVKVEPSDY